MRGRSIVVGFVVAASGCFTELPDVPGEASSGTGEASGATGTSAAMTTTTGGLTGEDQDPPTGGAGATTEAPPAGEGLFACAAPQPCEVWTLPDCAGACAADEAGACVLERLRVREASGLRVRRCDGACTLEVLLVRDAGTATLRRQRASEGPDQVLEDYQPPAQCELREEAFFAACLTTFTPECADPDAWVQGCGPPPGPGCG